MLGSTWDLTVPLCLQLRACETDEFTDTGFVKPAREDGGCEYCHDVYQLYSPHRSIVKICISYVSPHVDIVMV